MVYSSVRKTRNAHRHRLKDDSGRQSYYSSSYCTFIMVRYFSDIRGARKITIRRAPAKNKRGIAVYPLIPSTVRIELEDGEIKTLKFKSK